MRRFLYIILLCVLPACYVLANDHNTIAQKARLNSMTPGDTLKAIKDTTAVDSDDVKTRTFEFSLEGASDQTHYGLHNATTKLPYLEPGFTYTAKSGFYISTSDQFLLVKKEGGFDVFSLNPGWDVDLTDNTTYNFNLQYYHFKAKTPDQIKGSLASDLETYIEQDLGNFVGKFSIDYNIYKAVAGQPKTPNDIVFSPDISYDFIKHFGKKSEILVIPEADFDFGTRNFYTQYENNTITDSTQNNLKPKKKLLAGNTNSSFGTLDYNLILNLEYKIGKFSIEPAFTYSQPLYNPSNPPTKPTAFGSVTLAYTIESKK
jgi:hypothetical protein